MDENGITRGQKIRTCNMDKDSWIASQTIEQLKFLSYCWEAQEDSGASRPH